MQTEWSSSYQLRAYSKVRLNLVSVQTHLKPHPWIEFSVCAAGAAKGGER